MEEAIEAKNSIIRNLRYSMAHATKAYNDAIRVYEAKLVEFGIPAEELGLELAAPFALSLRHPIASTQLTAYNLMPAKPNQPATRRLLVHGTTRAHAG